MSSTLIPRFLVSFLLLTLIASSAEAFLDFIGDSVKETARAVAYADAVSELTGELEESSPVNQAAKDLAGRSRKLKNELSEVYFANEEFKSLLEGPDWSGESLEENIRFTTRYVRRAKKLLVQLGLVGTDVATAMNTAETNTALNQVLKNQQTQILLSKESDVRGLERELHAKKEWQTFIEKERSKRSER